MPAPSSSQGQPPGRSRRRGHGTASTEVLEALKRLEARLDGLEERLRSLEGKGIVVEICDPDDPTCSADLIGCLDDCVDDVKDIRKRVRDARTPERRH